MAHFPFFFALALIGLFASPIHGRNHLFEERSYSDLMEEYDQNETCKAFVLQKLFQQRMEAAMTLSEGTPDPLLIFHSQIEAIKSDGFSEEEFKKIQHQLSDQIDIFSSIKATVDSSSPVFLDADSSIPASSILHAFQHHLEHMQLVDLSTHLTAFLRDEPRAFRIVYPESLYKESDWTYDTATNNMPIRFADNVIKVENPQFFQNNPSLTIEPFYQLPLDEKEQKQIYDLIKAIAEKNIWGLLFKKKEMERMGKKVNHVHPMRFMGYILSEPKLKKWLKEIKGSSFKWDHFIDGFGSRMKEETAKNNIMAYIPGMAHLLQVDQSQILGFIDNKDYEGLVKSLL